LWKKYPHCFLQAGGPAVGLPEGQIGNSEIGHTTIGAGKVIDTDLVRINKSIESGEFNENQIFKKMLNHAVENNSAIHTVGLIGNGGVHSHEDHLVAFIKYCAQNNFKNLYLHLITDGRDASPYESVKSIENLYSVIAETGTGEIATVSGRYFAMDRDNNWDRLEKFTDLFWAGGENNSEKSLTKEEVIAEIESQHKAGKTDEHLEPFKVSPARVKNNDAIFFFNYRSDRARMLSSKILEKKAENETKVESEMNLFFATLTQYSADYDAEVAFPIIKIETCLAKEIADAGLTQVHLAETEKFPHATYFLNGGRETPHENEEHVVLPSNKHVKTHDEAPEMKAREIADEAIKRIENGVDFTFINFANPDMVGHTANVPAIITAVEFVDAQLKRVIDALQEKGGVAFITADHGNAELNFDAEKNEKHTAHTLNLVPAILTDENLEMNDGTLADIAPTILKLMGIEKPGDMTGNILI
jgi:2,3-bisphosphoglycerate-independent phosphoglycerate mutase